MPVSIWWLLAALWAGATFGFMLWADRARRIARAGHTLNLRPLPYAGRS